MYACGWKPRKADGENEFGFLIRVLRSVVLAAVAALIVGKVIVLFSSFFCYCFNLFCFVHIV
jgi:hypothetical protein